MPSQSATSRKAKAAVQEYKKAVDSNAKAVHDSLATATAKGVEEAHVQVISGGKTYPSAPGKHGLPGSKQLPRRLPDKVFAMVYEIVGALTGTLTGALFAVKELLRATEMQIKKVLGGAKKAV